jgi:carbohydrate kinase (thermoresistant glucokinase family)
MIKLLFGKAGSGKSYVGKLASLTYGLHFHDADEDLPERFRRAIENREKVTDEVRDEYIDNIIATIRRLMLANKDICICQALLRDKYREKILEAIPSVEYVWVDAPDDLILSRLRNRVGHIAPKDYAEMVNRIFEVPTVAHVRFENGNDPTRFDDQMKAIFGKRRRPLR